MSLIEIQVEEVHRTEKAVRVISEVTGRKVWVPLSAIKDYCGDEEDGFTSIFVSNEIAVEKDLI